MLKIMILLPGGHFVCTSRIKAGLVCRYNFLTAQGAGINVQIYQNSYVLTLPNWNA